MKRLSIIITVLILVVLLAFSFTGCSKLKGEKKLIESGEFVGNTKGEYDDQISLSVKSDKTYILNIFSYEEDAIVTYEGKWSYVMTYKYTYKPTKLSFFERLYFTERVTLYIFKLEGCSYKGQQGYFVYKGYDGKIYYTDEKVTKSHFDKQKDEENGSLHISGTDMKEKPNKDK